LSTPRPLGTPFDRLELRDRFARAADLMADLDARERQVVVVMASYGVGPVPAARYLGLPLGEVRSAVRSANAKLDRVAAITAAGRMCEFRSRAIVADAAGEAGDHEARLALAGRARRERVSLPWAEYGAGRETGASLIASGLM
jgi:hypothetical protein